MREDDEEHPIQFPYRLKRLSILISIICGALIIIHAIFPQFLIDTITIALVVILIVPWILPYVSTLKLPGGTEVIFKEEVQRLERLSEKSEITKVEVDHLTPISEVEPTRWDLFKFDPNLALASLRIDIEKILREISSQKNLPVERTPLRIILTNLHLKEIIGHSEFETLNLIIDICNKAVHAENVDASTASRILDIGESTIKYLNSIKK